MDTDHLTRQERRELRRMEQKKQQSTAGNRRLWRRYGIWAAVVVVLAGIVWGMARLASDVPVPNPSGTLTTPVSDIDNILGPASASVTLVEYSDFQCPACAAFHPIVKQLLEEPELQGKLRFVYRHFPLTNIHKNAQLAAQAAQAAAVQGAFWKMHDMLFENQKKWSGLSSDRARAVFLEYAVAAGINREQFAKDIDSDDVKEKIAADVAGGLAAGVDATPIFFVNGTRMPQMNSYADFKQYILTRATP
jgi:protein-disulfide isomerase